MKLFRVTIFVNAIGALKEAGTYEPVWVISDSIQKVSEKYPEAVTIKLITSDLEQA